MRQHEKVFIARVCTIESMMSCKWRVVQRALSRRQDKEKGWLSGFVGMPKPGRYNTSGFYDPFSACCSFCLSIRRAAIRQACSSVRVRVRATGEAWLIRSKGLDEKYPRRLLFSFSHATTYAHRHYSRRLSWWWGGCPKDAITSSDS